MTTENRISPRCCGTLLICWMSSTRTGSKTELQEIFVSWYFNCIFVWPLSSVVQTPLELSHICHNASACLHLTKGTALVQKTFSSLGVRILDCRDTLNSKKKKKKINFRQGLSLRIPLSSWSYRWHFSVFDAKSS